MADTCCMTVSYEIKIVCLPGGTLIKTYHAYMKMKEKDGLHFGIQMGDEVVHPTGKFVK